MFALLVNVRRQIAGGMLVQGRLRQQPLALRLLGQRAQLSHELTDGATEFEGTSRTITAPEGQAPGLSRRRRYDDAIAIDLLDNGATPNDSLDADLGPNLLMNFPEFDLQ